MIVQSNMKRSADSLPDLLFAGAGRSPFDVSEKPRMFKISRSESVPHLLPSDSSLAIDRVTKFLPLMKEANLQLQKDIDSGLSKDIECLSENERFIELVCLLFV